MCFGGWKSRFPTYVHILERLFDWAVQALILLSERLFLIRFDLVNVPGISWTDTILLWEPIYIYIYIYTFFFP